MAAGAIVQKQRIHSIDILRGVIMLVMVLDHTRDFIHVSGPLSDPTNVATATPILFITRWITHFCAPGFLFLSGVSAYLTGMRRSKSELSLFLIKRGLWLVLVEVVVMTFALTLNPHYNAIFLQILWAIGTSMILLGLLVRAPLAIIAVIGGLIFFGHDIFDLITLPKAGTANVLIKMFFTAFGTVFPFGKTRIILDLYAILPWTGVMMLGYVFGSLYKPGVNPQKRKNILMVTGTVLVVLFLVLRYFNIYGDPSQWSVQRNWGHSLMSFLNTSKYPCSLLFLCMTLGPLLIILSCIEHIQNKLSTFITVYGSVPFFYFVGHFYVIRMITIILFFASGFTTHQIVDPTSLFNFKPAAFGYSLGVVYLIWILVLFIMYFPCKWFSNYKKTHRQWWLSYL